MIRLRVLVAGTVLLVVVITNLYITNRLAESTLSNLDSSLINDRSLLQKRPLVRVLWGIFTMDTDWERERRALIRRTYLGLNDTRICSLESFVARSRVGDRVSQDSDCELIYTFVVGGSPTASTELLDGSRPMIINLSLSIIDETDVTSLNIRESMNLGKSQTWFKYASTLSDEYQFHYVAKCDSDTVVYPSRYFEFARDNLLPSPHNLRTYIGRMNDAVLCGGYHVKEPHCQALVGKYYMVGHAYLLSSDLVNYIVSDRVNRTKLSVGHEDYDIGMMVLSHPSPVRAVALRKSQLFWKHPVKEDFIFEQLWAKYLRQIGERGSIRVPF